MIKYKNEWKPLKFGVKKWSHDNFRYLSHKNALVVTWSLTDKLMFIEGDSGEIPNTKRNLKF